MAIVYQTLTLVTISMTVVTTVMKMAAVSFQDARLSFGRNSYIVQCQCGPQPTIVRKKFVHCTMSMWATAYYRSEEIRTLYNVNVGHSLLSCGRNSYIVQCQCGPQPTIMRKKLVHCAMSMWATAYYRAEEIRTLYNVKSINVGHSLLHSLEPRPSSPRYYLACRE